MVRECDASVYLARADTHPRENYSPGPPLVYFPIYQSTDKGGTWAPLSNVTDQVNGWGLRYQPFLHVLPQAIGSLAEGTIFCAENSII